METLLNPLQERNPINSQKTKNQQHKETVRWSSQLKFTFFELNFAKNLIDSYAFEPKTANSFLLLEEFKTQIEKLQLENQLLQERIKNHENLLGGIFESLESISDHDTTYNQLHQKLNIIIDKHISAFETLKAEIFEYCENVLRRKKRPS